jgi:hypothetical protein
MKAGLAFIAISLVSLMLGLFPFMRSTHPWRIASTGIRRGQPETGSPWARSSRWPKRPMGICGSAPNSVCSASMDFTLSPGNHRRGRNFPKRLTLCS